MANMVGSWKLDPKLTTGHEEFGKAMGMSDEEIKATTDVVYTFHLSRDGDEWAMKIDLETGVTWIDLKFRMGVPFSYMSLDKVTELTSLIKLDGDHFLEDMTAKKDGVENLWKVDTYREGDYVITIQTKDGKSEIQKLKKV